MLKNKSPKSFHLDFKRPTIYSPIPAYEDLIEELKDRKWMYASINLYTKVAL